MSENRAGCVTERDDEPVTQTLRSTRDRIDALRTPDGEFVVSCRDSGVRPEPVTDARFETYDDAERACAAARRYRGAMRTLDPALNRYALVVSAVAEGAVEVTRIREATDERRANGLPHASQTVTLAGTGTDEWLRVDNGPVVHLAGPDSPLDDEFVARQLDSKLGREASRR